jgi:hypothetical protein
MAAEMTLRLSSTGRRHEQPGRSGALRRRTGGLEAWTHASGPARAGPVGADRAPVERASRFAGD